MANGIDRLQLSVKIVPMSAVLGIFCNFVVAIVVALAASNARWVLAVIAAAAAAADRQQLLGTGEGGRCCLAVIIWNFWIYHLLG